MNSNLTVRELELLQAAADGKFNKQMGAVEQTVKNQFSVIYLKLEATNKAHAVAIALRRGLIK